jgi:glutaredoxin
VVGKKGAIMEKQVNLYITPKSPDTDKIKDHLKKEGVEFKVHDVHADVKAHKMMLEATRGACGAPVVEIGNQIVCGFDSERLDETIKYELK